MKFGSVVASLVAAQSYAHNVAERLECAEEENEIEGGWSCRDGDCVLVIACNDGRGVEVVTDLFDALSPRVVDFIYYGISDYALYGRLKITHVCKNGKRLQSMIVTYILEILCLRHFFRE